MWIDFLTDANIQFFWTQRKFKGPSRLEGQVIGADRRIDQDIEAPYLCNPPKEAYE